MLIQPSVRVTLRSKLLSTFLRPAHSWRQYTNSFGQKILKWAPSSGGKLPNYSGRRTSYSSQLPEDLARSSHRTQKKKKAVLASLPDSKDYLTLTWAPNTAVLSLYRSKDYLTWIWAPNTAVLSLYRSKDYLTWIWAPNTAVLSLYRSKDYLTWI